MLFSLCNIDTNVNPTARSLFVKLHLKMQEATNAQATSQVDSQHSFDSWYAVIHYNVGATQYHSGLLSGLLRPPAIPKKSFTNSTAFSNQQMQIAKCKYENFCILMILHQRELKYNHYHPCTSWFSHPYTYNFKKLSFSKRWSIAMCLLLFRH